MSPQRQREALVRALASKPVLRTGLMTGGLLVVVMFVSLFVANHIPQLEPVAWIRNDVCRLAFGVVMLIPILRFLFQPRRLFSSALIGWVIFTIGYGLAGSWYVNLFASLGRKPLEVFLAGIVTYGVVAVFSWVALLILAANRQPARDSQQGTEGARQPR
jgi:hypothetical protein